MLMVTGDWSCLRERRDGDGDLGAGEDRGASVGGSSLTVVGCCGVWARDDTLDTVDTWGAAGDLGGGVCRSMLSSPWGSMGLLDVDIQQQPKRYTALYHIAR
jgi:hypothetical protein